MNVAPIDGEYFHVSGLNKYHSYEGLKPGDKFKAGDKLNPFFGFYERTKQFRVTTPQGPVELPAISFLEEVHRGIIQCPDLSRQALNIAYHYNILARELILEEIRLKIAPKAPSRKTCLWVSETMEMAELWQEKITSDAHILRLHLKGTFHSGDARLMMNDSEPLSDAYLKAEKYWRSESSTNPLVEILFAGDVEVLSIEKHVTEEAGSA